MSFPLPHEFTFSAFLSAGWQLFKDKWGYLLKVVVIVTLASTIPQFFIGLITENVSGVLGVLLSLVAWVVQMVVNLAATKIVLELTNGKELPLTVGTFFAQKDRLITYIWANFLFGLRVVLGYLLFIIPGIIWTIQFQFVPTIVVDKNVTAGEAFGISTQMTQGKKLTLFWYAILFALINIVGFMAFFVGIFVTAPVTFLAYAVLYRYLEKEISKN